MRITVESRKLCLALTLLCLSQPLVSAATVHHGHHSHARGHRHHHRHAASHTHKQKIAMHTPGTSPSKSISKTASPAAGKWLLSEPSVAELSDINLEQAQHKLIADAAPREATPPTLEPKATSESATVAATNPTRETPTEPTVKETKPEAITAEAEANPTSEAPASPATAEAPTAEATETKIAFLPSAPSTPELTAAPQETEEGIIYIDNDGELVREAVEETYKWEPLPDNPGQMRLSAGVKFPVSVVSELSSKTAKVGDPVLARVMIDIKVAGKCVAPKNTEVRGHVSTCYPARKMLVAELSPQRWWRAAGAIGITFDEMVTASGEHLPLVAEPAKKAVIIKNKNEGRILGVNKHGELVSPLSIQIKRQLAHAAIKGSCEVAGAFSFGASAVLCGVVGAIDPSFAYLQPIGKNMPHRRIKGFAMGFAGGLPGGFLICDMIIKGPEAKIKPGDQFLVRFKQDFTGESSTDAEMMAAGQRKVRAEVLKKKKK